MDINIPQRTRVLVYECTEEIQTFFRKDGTSFNGNKLYAFSGAELTKFYITHGKQSVMNFLKKYYNYVECPNRLVYYENELDPNIVIFVIAQKKGNQ